VTWIKRKDREPRKDVNRQYLAATWLEHVWKVEHIRWDGFRWRVCNDSDNSQPFDFERWMEIPSPGRPTKEERG